jgi:hypothetical protein
MLRGHSPAFLGTTALIFGFCGLMTTLLVRSILFPENSQLATASPQAICELFASRSEGTDMDIYEGDTITGQCRITPLSGPPIPSRRLESVRVALNGTLQLRGPFASFGQLALNSRFDLSVTGGADAPLVASGAFTYLEPMALLEVDPPTGDVAGGNLAVTPSVSYRGDYSQFEFPNPILDQKAYSLVDLSIVWTDPSDRFTLGLYGKNLTDEAYRVGGYNFPGALFDNSIIGYYGPPRTDTASLKVSF